MFGKNPVRKQELLADGKLRIQEIFKTVQGEGPLVGTPAIFLRMASCNLRCFFCDTDFESRYGNLILWEQALVEILEKAHATNISLLVITGGEPFLQNLVPLVTAIMQTFTDWQVQFETAGAIWIPGLEKLLDQYPGRITIVCSPKTGTVHKMVASYCEDWKYIIRASDYEQYPSEDGLPYASTQIPGKRTILFRPVLHPCSTVYLQPCDEGSPELNKANTALTVELAIRHGYRVCLQTHKLLGLP